jgi:hypothetical protein
MAARKLNRESVDGPELVPPQGPMPISRLGGVTPMPRASSAGARTFTSSSD